MDRLGELSIAYDEALAAGEELLDVLRTPTGEPPIERIQQLIERREAAVKATADRFEPGDQEVLRDKLEALVVQQKALEAELARVIGDLRCRLQEVEAAKASARRSRRMMDAGRRGNLLDQRR